MKLSEYIKHLQNIKEAFVEDFDIVYTDGYTIFDIETKPFLLKYNDRDCEYLPYKEVLNKEEIQEGDEVYVCVN